MKLIKAMMSLLLLLMVLDGCSSKGGVNEEEGAEGSAADGMGGANGRGKSGAKVGKYSRGGASGRNGYGAGSSSGGSGELDDPSSPLAKRVIYFMYDSDEVMPEYRSVISTHASYLAGHPEQTVTLEGHADERGSSEYNIALSEQRAKSVARTMTMQGVTDQQIQVVSFGEEKPSVSGHDESSWQQNRRVEISYPGH
jgi:peptidoglycan-associated lipoprotein